MEGNPSEYSSPQSTVWGSDITMRSTPKKRRRHISPVIEPNEKELIQKFEDGLEKSLSEKAAKSNLSKVAVKSILKYVVTDENVLALLKQKENDGDISEIIPYEPKVTRSKAKQLSKFGSSITLQWEHAISNDSEVQDLLENLEAESSEGEYVPEGEEEEEASEDDSFSCTISNPPTPSTKKTPIDDEVFKTPKLKSSKTDKLNGELDQSNENNTTIALRTRSKLSLNETPLEELEQSFIPPDIPKDMCGGKDDDWINFINSIVQPSDEVVTNVEEEEDLDPEYNILSDEEITKVDTEELRDDRAVRVPRKELNELMAELFEYVDIYENRKDSQKDNFDWNMDEDYFPIQQLEIDRYIEIFDGASTKLLNLDLNEDPCYFAVGTSDQVLEQFLQNEDGVLSNLFSKAQFLLFQQQMCQHVQMLTQNFLLTYSHPIFHEFSVYFKEYLMNLKLLSNDKTSTFNTINLEPALNLIEQWEQKFDNHSTEGLEIIKNFEKVMEESIASFFEKKEYYLPFPESILQVISKSDVFLYPQLLPKIPFKHPDLQKCHYSPFSISEYQLIALGLEQFVKFLKNDKEFVTPKKHINMIKIAEVIHNMLMPARKTHQVYRTINDCKRSKDTKNPVTFYFKNKRAPFTVHQVIDLNIFGILPPEKRPAELLPRQWRAFIHNTTLKFSATYNQNNETTATFSLLEPDKTASVIPKKPAVYRKIQPKGDLPEIPEPRVKEKKKNIVRKQAWNDVWNLKRRLQTIFRRCIPFLKYVYVIKNLEFLKKYFPWQKLNWYPNFSKDDYMASLGMLPSMPCLDILTALKQKDEEDQEQVSEEGEKPSLPVDSEKEVDNIKQETVDKDNIEDINALVAACTTVKNAKKEQSLVDKKKAKKRKEYLASIAMMKPLDPASERERKEHFSQAYMKKMKDTLGREEFNELLTIMVDDSVKDAVDLYKKLKPIFIPKHQDLADEFLLFLTAEQAYAVGQLIPFLIMTQMSKFLRNLELYFKDQPTQLRKVYKSLQDLNDTPEVNLERIKSTIVPLLKSNPLLCDSFLQIFLEESPTATLLNGAWDVIDINKELLKAKEEGVFENISVTDEDPACACDCHKTEGDQSQKNHCVNCGLKFIQGKLFMQTPKGMKPVIVSFPLNPEVDHNARLNAPRKYRRIEPKYKLPISPIKENQDNSPTKENQDDNQTNLDNEEDNRKRKVRVCKPTKRTQPKEKKFIKKDQTKDITNGNKGKSISIKNSTRKKSAIIQQNEATDKSSAVTDAEWKNLPSPEYISVPLSDSESSQEEDKTLIPTVNEIQMEEDISEDTLKKEQTINDDITDRWTKEEDRILLETFKQNFHKDPISLIKQRLTNRSEEEICLRFDNLMNLLQEMYSKGDSKISNS